ncbi:histidine kinase [Nitritalea halalkaliphila]|nr:histidine kinase [Nitritalea halalkaliphila]
MKTTPDYFLQLIKKAKKGRLKIYLGMVAGVGKSYRMLQEAHELLQAGEDVRIGYIETHGRVETAKLVDNLPVIPLKEVFYKGKTLQELNLDLILEQRPTIVLVDELAHTNIPGSRNKKRWEDVLELIDAGIHVITACNVQHVESLYDKVKQLSGVAVNERVPDTFFRQADEIVSIDLPAEDLIKRLKHGKIYKKEKIEQALNHFFQVEKILQLRELALLEVAKNLEHKIQHVQGEKGSIVERFMACISTDEVKARKVIRKTSRLASNYRAEWLVVYVRTPQTSTERLASRKETKLLQNLHLASTLGAKIYIYESHCTQDEIEKQRSMHQQEHGAKIYYSTKTKIADVLYETAQFHNVTNIVIGKPNQSLWRKLRGKNHFQNLLQHIATTDIDLIVVT